ncbi:DUF6612 family protein [Streptomyces sp. NPDC051569]|uniref:DUF6612 family protein n=1 Tax=Streptomyces sp. NPDC051569 TaxID=3365661 RepID=UPI0037A85E99
MNVMYRKIAGAALGVALLCGTAACSSETAKPAADAKAAGKPAAKPVEVSPVAAVKRAADKNDNLTSISYTMSGTVPGEEGVVEAEAALSLKPLAMQMKMRAVMEGKKQEVEIRLTGEGMYLNAGEEAAKEMDGKSWMKFPMEALGEGQSPLGGLSGQANKNPAAESSALSVAEDLKKVGEETIDGVKTTHYSGTLTIADLAKGMPGTDAESKKLREQTLKSYKDMGVDKLVMEMWIDEQDHTKQFRTKAASKKGPLDLTIKFLDYNKPVTVTAPPAAETTDLGAMMESLGSDAS